MNMAIVTCLQIDDALKLTPIASEGAVEACQREDARDGSICRTLSAGN
jgi:hypothetical protein